MASVSLAPGQLFAGDFLIERELSEGGMGVVYVALQQSTGVRRALKVMQPQLVLARDPDKARRNQERFIAEARVGATIRSEHVVQVISAGVDPISGAPWFAMELLEGETLEAEILRRGRFTFTELLMVFEELCHALGAAHDAGVFHLDLKPENIFRARVFSVARRSTIKVLDFGISKIVSEHQRSTQLTQAIGTPFWMSPEQASRSKVSGATDVWSLGLIAFRMLTGKHYWLEANRPEEEHSLMSWLNEMCNQPLVSASERARALGVGAYLPAGFDDWFSRCVNRAREQRFANATEAWEALQKVLPAAPPPTPNLPPTAPVSTPRLQVEPTLLSTVPMTGDLRRPSASPSQTDSFFSRLSTPQRVFGGVGALGVASVVVMLLTHTSEQSRTEHRAPIAPAAVAPPTAPMPVPAARCPEGMILVNGGAFTMNDVARAVLGSFCIDRTEVTAARYDACVGANRCTPANESFWEGGSRESLDVDQRRCTFGRADQGEHPINCVTWDMAERYCLQRGAEIPTEAQWEFAARGTTGNVYPWGAEPPTPLRVNGCGLECYALWHPRGWMPQADQVLYLTADPWPTTAPVEACAGDRSSAGVLGLAGNVAEWTLGCEDLAQSVANDPTRPRCGGVPSQNIVRGGAWDRIESRDVSALTRVPMPSSTQRSNLGFRCAARVL